MFRHRARSLLTFALVSLALVACSEAPTAPDHALHADEAAATLSSHDQAGIIAPAADEVVFSNELELMASDLAAAGNTARWAVRAGTCAAGTGTAAGNVDGFDDAFEWDEGAFSATIDASPLDAGAYCFVLNTTQGPEAGTRLTREFFIVDEYVKIGGTIDMDPALLDPDFDVPGGPFSHSFEGVVGNAGGHGAVGTIVINYRWHGEHCTFTPSSIEFNDAPGIGVEAELRGDLAGADGVCDDGQSTSSAHLIALDRDASPDFKRGAVIVRWDGETSTSAYEIDASAGSTGADSWVPLERGNVHVGVR